MVEEYLKAILIGVWLLDIFAVIGIALKGWQLYWGIT